MPASPAYNLTTAPAGKNEPIRPATPAETLLSKLELLELHANKLFSTRLKVGFGAMGLAGGVQIAIHASSPEEFVLGLALAGGGLFLGDKAKQDARDATRAIQLMALKSEAGERADSRSDAIEPE